MHRNGLAPRRSRIAHISLGLDTGGQEKLLLEFARHADRSRFDLVFLSLTTRGRLAPAIESEGWPVVALGERPGFRPGITLNVASSLRHWQVSTVHTHDIKPLLYGAIAGRLAGAARVIHMRHFSRLAYLTPRQKWLGSLAARLVDSYVCVSEESARAALEEGVPSALVQTVWNGIDLERFTFAGPNAAGPVVLVARLSPEKDIATLIRAVALVARNNSALRLEIAGDGPCRAELAQLARSLGIAARVAFLGEVVDVAPLLSQASLFVLSSLTEGISLTILEAMARGLPVVATQVGGNPEIVLDGQTGLLVPPGCPQSLAKAMLQLQNDPARGQQLGQAGRQRVEQHFGVRRMVAAYEALYGPAGASA